MFFHSETDNNEKKRNINGPRNFALMNEGELRVLAQECCRIEKVLNPVVLDCLRPALVERDVACIVGDEERVKEGKGERNPFHSKHYPGMNHFFFFDVEHIYLLV